KGFHRVDVDAPAQRAAVPEEMRLRAFINREMTAGPCRSDVEMLQELLEPGIVIHSGRVPHKPVNGAAGGGNQFPQDDGIELQTLRFADVKDSGCLKGGVEPPPFFVIEHQNGAPRAEVSN